MTPAGQIMERLATSPKVVVPQLPAALRAFLAAELVTRGLRPVLVAKSQEDAERLYRDLTFFLGASDDSAPEQGLHILDADEESPYEEHTPDARAVMERLDTLYRLAREPERVRALVVSPRALSKRHVPPTIFDRGSEYLLVGAEVDRQRLLAKLADGGYNAVSSVDDPGTFSVRGGIIDVWSPYRTRPLRIDLFGDEVESIRLFDPATQRNGEKLDEVMLLPAREVVFDAEVVAHAQRELERLAEATTIPSRKLHALLEDVGNRLHFFGIEALLPAFHPGGLVSADHYLPRDARTIYLVDPDSLVTLGEDALAEARLGHERARLQHALAYPPEFHLADAEEVLDACTRGTKRVELPEVALEAQGILHLAYDTTDDLRGEILKATRSKDQGEDVLHPLVHRLKKWRADGLTSLVVCQTRGQAERLRQLLEPKNLQVRLLKTPFALSDFSGAPGAKLRDSLLRDRSVHAWLAIGELSGGFVLPEAHLAFVSEEEIFGQRIKRRRKKAAATAQGIADLKDLVTGDYVVHVDHGIGLYKGMTKLVVGGVDSDYLLIEYKGGDKLYLPVVRLRLISKYVSATEGRAPALDKLGGTSWATAKKKVKDTLLKMAAELLRLYAMRQTTQGFAFPAPDERFAQFEAEFAFEPTPDQARAIGDVVQDLQRPSPMDRLICGDVGYGKTEVAMRATMMALAARKQTAVLVPTTVLAAQHHRVFKERFANFTDRVAIISRFQSPEEVRKTLAGLKDGSVDIVIGTHRILGKDVGFADLGLLVIDEEHRFGVAHKERLKKYRAHVHVLAMSATPIPRSLHMGFMGVRDMSVIATPPEDRLAVKTEVHKFSEEVIREAILREIKRGGQCFVVHDRVSSIGAFAKLVERLVPEARVAVGHGQMSEDALEKVMVDFMNQEYNVLLSTTIIESGIDIPNANTIIINRADHMGLAQLYQLRGRVGRSKARGFAFMLIPAGNLTKKARARIAVLQRFTELGAGFKVASKDLEIRGAGNLLGQQQSGTITAVGFDMYQALLEEAIAELKGSHRASLKEPELNLPVPALIPDAYVPPAGDRLAFYQRFNAADTDEAAYDILQELTDLYGNPPAEVENLTQLMLVKQRLGRVGALGLDYAGETKLMPARLVVRFDADEPQVTPEQFVKFVSGDTQRRKLTPDGKLVIHLLRFEDIRDVLQQAKDQLDALVRLKHRPKA